MSVQRELSCRSQAKETLYFPRGSYLDAENLVRVQPAMFSSRPTFVFAARS